MTGEEKIMGHMWMRVAHQLVARFSGPLRFRVVLQPLIASFFAIRSGLADASDDKPPYFWGLFWNSGHRTGMIKEGWGSIGRVFLFALLMDVVYQVIELRFVYVGEAIIVATVLAILPFLILRGLVTRLARMKHAASTHPGTTRVLRD